MREKRKRYYYYQQGKIKSELLYSFQINSSYHKTKSAAKKFGLKHIASQMNNLLNAIQEYVDQRKQLERL